jgi:hypothetical protein
MYNTALYTYVNLYTCMHLHWTPLYQYVYGLATGLAEIRHGVAVQLFFVT